MKHRLWGAPGSYWCHSKPGSKKRTHSPLDNRRQKKEICPENCPLPKPCRVFPNSEKHSNLHFSSSLLEARQDQPRDRQGHSSDHTDQLAIIGGAPETLQAPERAAVDPPVATCFISALLRRVMNPRRGTEEPSSHFQPSQLAQPVLHHRIHPGCTQLSLFQLWANVKRLKKSPGGAFSCLFVC